MIVLLLHHGMISHRRKTGIKPTGLQTISEFNLNLLNLDIILIYFHHHSNFWLLEVNIYKNEKMLFMVAITIILYV